MGLEIDILNLGSTTPEAEAELCHSMGPRIRRYGLRAPPAIRDHILRSELPHIRSESVDYRPSVARTRGLSGVYLRKAAVATDGLQSSWIRSIVISGLQEIDCFIGDPIHQTVFLSDSSRPTAAEHVFQWLGLSGTFERISHDRVNKVEDPQRDRALVLNPEAEILKKLTLKYRDPFSLSPHPASLSSKQLLLEV